MERRAAGAIEVVQFVEIERIINVTPIRRAAAFLDELGGAELFEMIRDEVGRLVQFLNNFLDAIVARGEHGDDLPSHIVRQEVDKGIGRGETGCFQDSPK